MTNDWKTVKLKEICSSISSGGTPDTRIDAYWNGDIPWLSSGETGNRYILDTEKKITKSGVKNSSTRLANVGDIAIASAGQGFTRGQAAYLLIDTYVNQSVVVLKANNKKVDSRFLFFNIDSRYSQLRDISDSHSSRGSLTTKLLAGLEVNLPSLSEQRAIAEILGALDDKIEVNRRTNATLESMARAVFRETMKNEDGIWNTGSILEFANLLSGGTPSTSEASYWNGNIEWASAKDVGNVDSIFLLDTEKKITQKGVDTSSTKLLPAKTTIVTARGTVGAHCMLGKAMTMNQTNYGLKAKNGIGDYFVYFTLSEMVEQLKQQSYGTIFDTITTKTFQSAQCVQPSHDVIQKFESQVKPLMDAILNNQEESRTLGSLRDSLLPKLMRGEVCVKEVEEKV